MSAPAFNLADLAVAAGRRSSFTGTVVDIITFVESPWGLNMRLFPVQRVILKAHYGLELDDNPHGFPLDKPVSPKHPAYRDDLLDDDGYYKHRIPITDWRRENPKVFTEAGYLAYLHAEKRCNIGVVTPGHERREMILSIGRRSGKTLLSSCIAAYETYKLISKGHPQGYYGLPDSNVIQIISVATDKDQAGLLYREVHGHFVNCDFFDAYMANATQSFATFQTPSDIEKFGSYKENPRSRFSVKVTFRSCVAKGLRGAGNVVVILDEVAHFTEDGQSGAEQVYNAVTPSTSAFSPKDPQDSRKPIGPVEGRIILISSPLGKQGQFYKLFQIGMTGAQAAKNMLCVEAPTWEVNPTVPASEFEKHYIKDPAVFFTEYGGQFSDRTSGWLKDSADLIACIDPKLTSKTQAPPRMPHFMGLDVALVNDYSALSIGHVDPQGRIVVDCMERIRAGDGKYQGLDRLEFDQVIEWAAGWCRKFYISEGIFDQWAGIPLQQGFAKLGLSQLKMVNHGKVLSSQMYQNLLNMVLDQKVVLFDRPNPDGDHADYIEELLELQAEIESKYIVNVEAPKIPGKHDDYSDALARMAWVATQNMQTKAVIIGSHFSKGGVSSTGRGMSPMGLARGLMKAHRSGSHPSRTLPVKKGGWR